MNITVNSEKTQDNKVIAKVTVDAKDVDEAINKAYKEISKKYTFQGFRKGKTPRPVIDSVVGKEAVMAQATNDLLDVVEPLMVEELDIVPLGDVDYGEDPQMVEEGKDYQFQATITVRPLCELDSYEAPSIKMPPANATDAEIEEQIDKLMTYHTNYVAVEDRGVEDQDICQVHIDNVDGAEQLEGDRMVSMALSSTPQQIKDALMGMKVGETKEVTIDVPESDSKMVCNITLKEIKEPQVPELSEDFVKTNFGFESVADFRDALKKEIEEDKKVSLPNLKEDRVVAELEKHLKLDETPEEYTDQVYREIAQDFLGQLQRQGMSLDAFLASRDISAEDFLKDLRKQAEEHARQSLALDALAAKLKLEATIEDIKDEFKRAGMPEVDKTIKDFKKNGQLPAIRESIKRTKALKWLCDNAQVTEVDEVAERHNVNDAEEGNSY